MNSFLRKLTITRTARYFALCIALAAASFSNAFGQTTTFAQYVSSAGGQNYVFTNNVTNGNFNTTPGGAPVFFFYQNIVGLPAELQGLQLAHVFVTTTTTQSGSTTGPGGTATQPLNSQVTIQIVRDIPASPGTGGGSRTNLLTAVINPSGGVPSLTGTDGGTSATLSATTPAHNVVFTSHFLSFAATTSRNLGLSFSSVSPAFTLGAGNFLQSFNAAGTGTFATNPVPLYIGPTAADVTVAGRVSRPDGQGLGNALVTLTEQDGPSHTVRTDRSGQFRFDGIAGGQAVVISVRSKLFSFSPQVVTLDDNAFDISFTPNP